MFYRINQILNTRMGLVRGPANLFIPKIKEGIILYNYLSNTSIEKNLSFDVYNPFFLGDCQIIISNSAENKSYLFEINDNNVYKKYTYNFNFRNHINNKLAITGRYNEDFTNYFTGVFDFEKQGMLWEKIFGAFPVDGYLFGKTQIDNLARFSLETGEVLWSYSFAGYPKTKNIHGKEESVSVHNSAKAFTGVIDNKLWVSLNTSQHLILDINTGEQIALLGQPYKYTKDYYAQKVMSGGQIDEKQKKIISLGNSQYREINTDTFEATFIDLREEFDKYGVSSVGDTRFDDDYIYFYDKIFFGEQPRNKVAVLDRKTLKVVWVHDFAQYGTFPMQMEKTDRHLFVLDSGGTLHIFERDEVA